jgi:exodeoxyribonuclease VII large subunit
MLNTLRRRYPLAEVVLSPASVQGEGAPAEIIAALKKLNELVKPDVILLGRGGGSIEDLWVFNDEEVARAVASSQTPIISGVGHETDFTITDFVADLRAPTPTAAAELATPDKVELKANLFEQRDYLVRLIVDRLDEMRWELASLQNRALRSSPQARLLNDRQRLDELMRRAGLLLGHGIQLKRAHLAGVTQQVAALSPAGVLARGFAVVTGEDGKIIGKLADVNIGDVVSTYLAEGNFTSNVTQKSASKKK